MNSALPATTIKTCPPQSETLGRCASKNSDENHVVPVSPMCVPFGVDLHRAKPIQTMCACWEPTSDPVSYSLTAGLSGNFIRRSAKSCVSHAHEMSTAGCRSVCFSIVARCMADYCPMLQHALVSTHRLEVRSAPSKPLRSNTTPFVHIDRIRALLLLDWPVTESDVA